MKKILVVEDNNFKFEDIKESLEECGETDITRKISRNGACWELLMASEKDAMYDLVILDMQIPLYEDGSSRILEKGGLEVFAEIQRCEYKTKVAFCSGLDVECEDVLMCIKYNSSVYLTPYIKELLEKCEEA